MLMVILIEFVLLKTRSWSYMFQMLKAQLSDKYIDKGIPTAIKM